MKQLTIQLIEKFKLVNDDVPKLTDIFMGFYKQVDHHM